MYFSRPTENNPFVQRMTNGDVLTNSIRHEHNFFRKQFTGHLRPSAGSTELQSIQSTFQQRSDSLSKLQRVTQVLERAFVFSTTDYCTVELVSVAKLHSTLCEKGKSFFSHDISQTLIITESTNILSETIQIRLLC